MLYYLLQHDEVSLVRLRAVQMTKHPPSVLWHWWFLIKRVKNIINKMAWLSWVGC